MVNRQVGKKDRKNITYYCHNLPPNRIGHNIRVETYCHLVLSQKVSKMVEKGQKIWQKNPTQTYQILRKKREECNSLLSQCASKPHWPQRWGWDVPPQRQPLLIQQAQLWSRTSLGQVQPEEVWVHKSSWSEKEERKVRKKVSCRIFILS